PLEPMAKQEMSMEIRLLIAFVLMGLVLFLTPYFYKQPPAPAAASNQTKNSQTNPAASAENNQANPPPKPPAPTEPAAPVPGAMKDDQERAFIVDTEVFHVVFSNRGAIARNWILKAYKDRQGKPLELVNQRALAKVPGPFAVALKTPTQATDPNFALF